MMPEPGLTEEIEVTTRRAYLDCYAGCHREHVEHIYIGSQASGTSEEDARSMRDYFRCVECGQTRQWGYHIRGGKKGD